MSEKTEKELIKTRASFKGRLTAFCNHLKSIGDSLNPVQVTELQLRLVEDRFVFPGEYQKPEVFEKPVIPEECKEIGICEDIPNYPEELVDNLIHELVRQNRTRFNKDMLEVPQIAQRIGPEDDNIELCDTVEKLYAPRAAQDSNMEWHVIVNDKKKPQQTFRVEICKAKESPCSSIAYFQNGYKARCVQKFMLRNMLAINDQKVVVEKAFQVPSCCSCIARQT